MKELKPRERVERVLRHEPVDRVPLFYRFKHEAKEKLAKMKAEKAKKEAAEKAEKELEERFSAFKVARAQELLDKCSADDLDKLHDRVAEALPPYADFRRRWQDVDCDYRNLDRRKATDAMIFRGYVVPEPLSLWGKPEDTDLEAFRSKNMEPA